MTSPVRERERRAAPDSAGAGEQRPAAVGRILALVTAVVLVVGGVVVWFTPVLGLSTIEVAGTTTSHVSDAVVQEVRDAVAVPAGTPLARIDLDGVRDRALAVDSVSEATAARQWPHTLVVTVVERVAVAAVQANGRWWLLDAAGTPFSSRATRPDGLMPVQLATPGTGDRATLAALGVLAALSPEVRDRVVGISAVTGYDVTLFISGGGSVIWGSDSDAAAKNSVIPALLDTAELGTTGKIVDVSDPTLVTVRAAQADGDAGSSGGEG